MPRGRRGILVVSVIAMMIATTTPRPTNQSPNQHHKDWREQNGLHGGLDHPWIIIFTMRGSLAGPFGMRMIVQQWSRKRGNIVILER
jgi:hypothetical protein